MLPYDTDLCAAVLEAIVEIAETCRAEEFSFMGHRPDEFPDQLHNRIDPLYQNIAQTLRGMLKFYKEVASGRLGGEAQDVG